MSLGHATHGVVDLSFPRASGDEPVAQAWA